MNSKRQVIFDFGANSGQNIKYFLSRADKVIAIEANPVLCAALRADFSEDIASGQLVIENYVITDVDTLTSKFVNFYISNTNSVLSQFPIPKNIGDFTKIELPSATASQIVRQHLHEGENLLYIKIDLEGYDVLILKNLFCNGIYPEYISAESHSIETFASILNCGEYKAFALVEGINVPNLEWVTSEGDTKNFKAHSAGPFGLDIQSPWFDAQTFFQVLFYNKLGWKDVHASKNSNGITESLSISWVIRKEFAILAFRIYSHLVPFKIRKYISRLKYLLRSLRINTR